MDTFGEIANNEFKRIYKRKNNFPSNIQINAYNYQKKILKYLFIFIFYATSLANNIESKIYFASSIITVQINKEGRASFLNDSFTPKPNQIIINDNIEINGITEYNFTQTENTIQLIWGDNTSIDILSNIFKYCSDINKIDFSNFDTLNVIRMEYMFYGCSNLKLLNLSNFDTLNVIHMEYMFRGCSNLKSLDLSNFDTSKVQHMGYMFGGCSNLESLDLSDFDTSKVSIIGYMFMGCSNLKSLNLSNFDTSNVQFMDNMFGGCSNLKSLDLSNFNASKTQIIEILSYFDKLEYLTIDSSLLNKLTLEDIFLNKSNLITCIKNIMFNTTIQNDLFSIYINCSNNNMSIDLFNNNEKKIQIILIDIIAIDVEIIFIKIIIMKLIDKFILSN